MARIDPTTVPVTVSLVRLKCIEQEDTEVVFDTQDDEPYVLVMAVDGQRIRVINGIPAPVVAAQLRRIGPIEDFDQGDVKEAPLNALWGLHGAPAPIGNIDRVFFLVALLDNDSAKPSEVEERTVLAQAGLPGLASVAFAREGLDDAARFELFVATARQAMNGTVSGARMAFPDPDDQLGEVQVLRFSDQEQQDVLSLAVPSFERTLTLEGDDAKYELTFSLSVGFTVADRTPIAAHTRDPNHMELWVVDAAGDVRGNYWNGNWHAWYRLRNPAATFPQRAHLAAFGRKSEHMEVLGVSVDGQLRGIWWDGDNWRDWYALGAPAPQGLPPGAPLAACSRFKEHMEVWVVGNDHQVHAIWWDGAHWRDWYALPGASFPPGASLVVHSRNHDHMEIFCIDESGVLRGNWWDGNWQGWYALPTPSPGFGLRPGGNLAVLGRNDDHMELWTVGGDDRLHGIWWDGSWHDWYTLAGPFSFPPGAPLSAITRHDDTMEVMIAGDDNRLHGIWWDGAWQPWYTLGPIPVPRGTPVRAMSRSHRHMEAWCVAPENLPQRGVQGVWWDREWKPFYRLG
jgi:hypothetical protein